MNALEISGLTKHYSGFSLENLNLTLPSGCILGLIGENGAGKSTTIRLILDMIRRDAGTINIFGKDNRERMELLKEDIGVVLDEAGIPGCLNTAQVGGIMGRTFRNWSDEVYSHYLKVLSVPAGKKFQDFSRGMKMKLGIAVALSHDPKLLVLDECTNGLDPVARDEVLHLFSEFTRDEGHAILISSHIVSDLEKLCDYIAILHEGRLLLCEEKDALLERYGLFHGTRAQLSELMRSAVLGSRGSDYGVEALVDRTKLANGTPTSPVSIEELFVFLVKGEEL